MLLDVDSAEFATKTGPEYLVDELRNGTISWWPPYDDVHEYNRSTLIKL